MSGGWPFVIAAYAVAGTATIGVVGWAWAALRRAEVRAERIAADRGGSDRVGTDRGGAGRIGRR